MCRWAAYRGKSVWLEDVVINPCRSLLWQSHHAHEAKTNTHADGLGLVWYNNDRQEPGLYRNTGPAWSDPNLKSLCHHVRAPLFMAHIRAATDGETAMVNCHPFVSGRWSFMHNGQIGHFNAIKRGLEQKLTDFSYNARHGATDSELLFLMLMDAGLDKDPKKAIDETIAQLMLAYEEKNLTPHLRLTCAFTDGDRIFAIRYATDHYAPTLYARRPCGDDSYTLVSEPLDEAQDRWQAIAPSSFVCIDDAGLHIEPLLAPCLKRVA